MASTKKPKTKQGLKKRPYTSKKSFSLSRAKRDLFSSRFIRSYLLNALSILCILLGATLIFLASIKTMGLDITHPFLEQKQEFSETSIPKTQPTLLYIPKLSRKLSISEGTVVGNRWTISPGGVSFYTNSAVPGTSGNSVIYGHNLANVLGDLYLVEEGDPIYVVLSSGSIVKYQVFEEKEVTPETVGILDPTQESRLTVYTCSGFLDSARFVVVAKQTQSI